MDTLNKRRFFITMLHPLGIQDTNIWAKAISAHAKKCSRMEVLIFIIEFHFFQCNNSTLPTKLINKKCEKSHGR